MKSKRTCALAAVVLLGIAASPPAISAAENEREMLRRTSRAFSEIAERVMPGVVSIKVEKEVEVEQAGRPPFMFNDPFDFFGDEFRRRFFPDWEDRRGDSPQRRRFMQRGAGSGFIVSEDGYILSNNHVVGDADNITVRLTDGREFEAELIGTDPKSEIALVKIDSENLPVLKLGDSANIRVGEWVVAIGNPFGLTETLTVGVVSAKGRSNIGIADYENFIQTDAAINPGNSGGPLLNIDGEVIGINTAIFSRSGGYMGIGFAIPIDMARHVKRHLLEHGEVIRGYLGIYIQPVSRELAESFDLPEPRGILVSQVQEGGAADEAGLQAGDVILALNGEEVEEVSEFRNTVSFQPPGTELTLRIFRDGREKEVVAVTAAFPDDEIEVAEAEEMLDTIGFNVQDLTPEIAERLGYDLEAGVVVSEVRRGSRAARAGIRPGSLIASVNREPVNSEKEFRQEFARAREAGRVLFLVRDRRGSRFVVMQLD